MLKKVFWSRLLLGNFNNFHFSLGTTYTTFVESCMCVCIVNVFFYLLYSLWNNYHVLQSFFTVAPGGNAFFLRRHGHSPLGTHLPPSSRSPSGQKQPSTQVLLSVFEEISGNAQVG